MLPTFQIIKEKNSANMLYILKVNFFKDKGNIKTERRS